VVEHALAIDAVVADGRCSGARFLDDQGRHGTATAAATLLATGGAGRVFRETTNPPAATGDGIAIAYLLWSRGMKTIGQSRTAVYQNLVPVIALATAWMWLGETPTPQQLGGAAVILSGIAVARGLAGGRRRRAR